MVYLAGQEIPKSPLKVTVESSIDVSKVKVVGLEPRKICFYNFNKLSPIFSLFFLKLPVLENVLNVVKCP